MGKGGAMIFDVSKSCAGALSCIIARFPFIWDAVFFRKLATLSISGPLRLDSHYSDGLAAYLSTFRKDMQTDSTRPAVYLVPTIATKWNFGAQIRRPLFVAIGWRVVFKDPRYITVYIRRMRRPNSPIYDIDTVDRYRNYTHSGAY